MDILITGAKGLLGTNIRPILERAHKVIALDIDEWDITDIDRGEAVLDTYRPHVLINLAAITDVDGCEAIPELAEKVNAFGPAILARLCKDRGVKLIHFSTDYIFDGKKASPYREDDIPNPLSVYGRTKLLGEGALFRVDPDAIIIRTEWLYGDGGTNFITKIIDVAKRQGRVAVVDDQLGSPTYAKDIAWPLKAIIEKGLTGIYHLSNKGACTWYGMALEVFRCLKMDVEVMPIKSETLDRKAKRPSYSVFDCTKIERATGIIMREWQEALRAYLGVAG